MSNGSSINVISQDTIQKLDLTPTPHLSPFKVSRVDSTSLPIPARCLLPIQIKSYYDKLWLNVIPMNVGRVISSQP